MSREQKVRAVILAVLCLGYVLVFVPANRTGAQTATMLSVFEMDEFAQYRALWKMTDPSETVGEAIRKIATYEYYYYGFPFFGTSVPVFWPLRSAYLETGQPGLTAASMLALRELSPLFSVLAIAILVVLWTRLRSTPHMIALFAFLVTLPSVVLNNFWWHPDALLLLGISATIAGLALDRSRLGRWFYAAALACGFATATKAVGLWFFAAVAIHLYRARSEHPVSKLVMAGAGFAATMALGVLASSPQFLFPSEWPQITGAMAFTKFHVESGWSIKGATGVAPWIQYVRSGFAGLTVLTAIVGLAAVTAFRSPRRHERDLAVTILSWVIPASCFLVTDVALHRERYLLPFLLPLVSCVGSSVLWKSLRGSLGSKFFGGGAVGGGAVARVAAAAMATALCVQFGTNLQRDWERYQTVLHREEHSPALAFWDRLDDEVLSQIAPDVRVRIFRDVAVYVPPERRFEVHVRWRSTEYGDIASTKPDFIVLRRSEIDAHADRNLVERSTYPEQALRAHYFHRDAKADSIPGYRNVLEDEFGVAFRRTDSISIGATRPIDATLP